MKVFAFFMKQFILIISIVFASISVWGQINISGHVYDTLTHQLITSIQVKEINSSHNAFVSNDGSFSIIVSGINSKIEIVSNGYFTKQVQVNSLVLKVYLQPLFNLEDSIAKNTQNQSSNQPVLTVAQALKGKTGIRVRANSGTPTTSEMDILIRRREQTKERKPLYVVDGVPVGDNPNIDPDYIENIDIFKTDYNYLPYANYSSMILITTKSGLRYPKYKKGSHNDFTKQIEQQLKPNAQKIGFTGSIDVRCSLDTKGALRVDNIPANVDYNFKQLVIQAIESDDEWTPATYDGIPIEMSFLFEFEF